MSTASSSLVALASSSQVVTQYVFETLPFLRGRQPLRLYHCVQRVFLAPFYGEFSLYDKSGRLLGRSVMQPDGPPRQEVSLLRKDLQTECAQVWYDAYVLQGEGAILTQQYHIEDPGLFFGFGEIFIEFEQAPDVGTTQVYPHIPLYFHTTNVWDPVKKTLLFQ